MEKDCSVRPCPRQLHSLATAILLSCLPPAAHAAQSPDACTLLSLAELSQASGLAIKSSDPVSTTEGSTCLFHAPFDSVTLALWQATPERFPELRETLELGGETTDVSGVGDAAFYCSAASMRAMAGRASPSTSAAVIRTSRIRSSWKQ